MGWWEGSGAIGESIHAGLDDSMLNKVPKALEENRMYAIRALGFERFKGANGGMYFRKCK